MSDLYQPDSALDLLQRFEGNSEARLRYLHERFDRICEFDVQLKAMAAVRAPDAVLRAMIMCEARWEGFQLRSRIFSIPTTW